MKLISLDAAGYHDGRDFLKLFPVGWRRMIIEAWILSQVEGTYTTAIRDGDQVHVAIFWRMGRWTTLFWL